MLVVGRNERADSNKAVAAGPVLNNHRLIPARRQSISEQTRGDVGGATRTQRQNELDRPPRPGLCLRHRG